MVAELSGCQHLCHVDVVGIDEVSKQADDMTECMLFSGTLLLRCGTLSHEVSRAQVKRICTTNLDCQGNNMKCDTNKGLCVIGKKQPLVYNIKVFMVLQFT